MMTALATASTAWHFLEGNTVKDLELKNRNPKIKMYHVYHSTIDITPAEVDRESVASVWIGGRQLKKYTSFESYHPSFEDAKNHLYLTVESELRIARGKVNRLTAELEKIKQLKEGDA